MPTYVVIPNGDIDQDSPITQPLMTALRDNIEAAARGQEDAPVGYGWHPYDMLDVGDGATGKFWDAATSAAAGANATPLTTPEFERGWDYSVILKALVTSPAGSLNVAFQRGSTAAWSAALASVINYNAGVMFNFTSYPAMPFTMPDELSLVNLITSTFYGVAGNPTILAPTDTAIYFRHGAVAGGVQDRISAMRFTNTQGLNFSAGQAFLFRRKHNYDGDF